MIEEKISESLKTVCNNVYPVVMPKNPDYPVITYHRKSFSFANQVWNLNPLQIENAVGEKSIFQIAIFARSYTEATKLLHDVRVAIEKISTMVLETIQDNYDWQQDIFVITTDWQSWNDFLEQNTVDHEGEQEPKFVDNVEIITQSIINKLDLKYGSLFNTIGFYDSTQRNIEYPALVVDVKNIESATRTIDGSLLFSISFIIYCLHKNSLGVVVDIESFIRFNRWGLPNIVNYPENIRASCDEIKPNICSVWAIEWKQDILMKKDSEDYCIESEPVISYAPNIGKDHEKDYEPL